MNTETGELKRLISESEKERLRKKVIDTLNGAFIPVPEKLEEEANDILGDKDSVIVDMSKDTPLVKWAKKNNRKSMQKASKKRNRNKRT